MAQTVKFEVAAVNDDGSSPQSISPLSKELIVGFVGYAGAGCSTIAGKVGHFLDGNGYTVSSVKLSQLIESKFPEVNVPVVELYKKEGPSRLARAKELQNLGDELRRSYGNHAIASLAIKDILEKRGEGKVGEQKRAFIIESIKHDKEIELLRQVYGDSVWIIAVHCDRKNREKRLIGGVNSSAKYHGAKEIDVLQFMDRDENDTSRMHGQHVRNAFYLADYFIDNNGPNGSPNINVDVERFVNLILSGDLVRPTVHERAMYHAHAAALQSSCLSRQVGAVLVSAIGEVIATGTNDAPMFGGGVYGEGSARDHRCFKWEWDADGMAFKGCHNDRKKQQLRENIGVWLSDELAQKLAENVYPLKSGTLDPDSGVRSLLADKIRNYLKSETGYLSGMPGIKDIIEYSRAIHAEMDAVLSAARSGISTIGATLYCTTYPCHNCARHLVAAGVSRVYYVEPYVKSLATELHSDSITNELSPASSPIAPTEPVGQMAVVPFTGVGAKMYEDFFVKRGKLKGPDGRLVELVPSEPSVGVRLRELKAVEQAAADLVP